MDQSRIQRCVELVCEKGCTEVLSVIDALADKRAVQETDGFSELEKTAVLAELRAIMAVYEDKR
jgi:hypothetical protein